MLHPSTEAELRLMEERDAAIARAEQAEKALKLATTIQHTAREIRLIEERDAALSRAEQAEALLDLARRTDWQQEYTTLLKRAHTWRDERDAARTMLENAELRCARLDRELAQVSEECRDTAMVAESIVAAPIIHDAKLETALIDALNIIGNLSRRCGGAPLSPAERARLVELQRLVPS